MPRALAAAVAAFLVCAHAERALALPNPGPLRFISPTPAQNALVTSGTVTVQVDAACTFDPGSLAVSLNGTGIPQGQFLPFSACANNRVTSQPVVVGLTLPNGTISGAPASLNAGQAGNFSGSGTGDALAWNFDGGSAPAAGSAVAATFAAAGQFTVRLRATRAQGLDGSGLDGGNLVTAERDFAGGDPTPDSRVVSVAMPPDVDFRNYEAGHVHPLALSAGGGQLYAVNTPEGRLSIFTVGGDGSLALAGEVAVGVDPVSLAVRPGTNEVWVVNHLSDNVSVVDVVARKVLATLAVGDEPTDVVFASGRAFVSVSAPEDRVNQDHVKVFNASDRALLATIPLFGDKPRALAANAAGTEVYAVVLESGNRTTTLFEEVVNPPGPPAPNPARNPNLGPAPLAGLIVKGSGASWVDESGGVWTNDVGFSLPDSDLFVIDADAGSPAVLRTVSGIGTILFDVVARPGTNEVWVVNTDARNLVRFEPKLRGHLVDTRVTKVNPAAGGGVTAQINLNGHINYAVTPGSPAEIADSLAQPGDGVFTASGGTFYLTAFGSGKVAVLNGAGQVTARIAVGGGPSGVALKESAARLYVMNRFDNTISIVDTGAQAEVGRIGVAGTARFDPSPDVVKNGRKFLYDGRITSGHGDTACATCHIFGNFDNIAWDLGDPPGDELEYGDAPWVQFFLLGASQSGFDPMKGPMTTQTLRGLKNLDPFHWRGDRRDFQAFNPAFVGLMGMQGFCSVSTGTFCNGADDCPAGQSCLGITAADMDLYTAFIDTVNFPPNPFRNPNNTLPTSILVPNQTTGMPLIAANPQNGSTLFSNAATPQDAGVLQCGLCHALPTGTNNQLFNGQQEGETQDFKIPHMRNMYDKVGFEVLRPGLQSGNAATIGPAQLKKGFGFLHDGSVSLTEFLAADVFVSNAANERDLFAFMLAFPTGSIPAIGRQVRVDAGNKSNAGVITDINTLVSQAETSNCDLIAKGVLGGVAKGFTYDRTINAFVPDSVAETSITESALRGSIAAGDVLVYTGVPPGSGTRLGIDRDRDTFLDRTEATLGLDPADPRSNPWKF